MLETLVNQTAPISASEAKFRAEVAVLTVEPTYSRHVLTIYYETSGSCEQARNTGPRTFTRPVFGCLMPMGELGQMTRTKTNN